VTRGDAKTPPECFEYILVDEMVHLLEPTHSARFAVPMDLYLPHWQHLRRQLNQLRSATKTITRPTAEVDPWLAEASKVGRAVHNEG
jgi:hypothetical protein